MASLSHSMILWDVARALIVLVFSRRGNAGFPIEPPTVAGADCDDHESAQARDCRRDPGDDCNAGIPRVGYAARPGSRAMAHLRTGGYACRRDRQVRLGGLSAARRLD